MSSIHGMFLKLAGLDRQAQAGRGKNAATNSPLAIHHQASTGRSTDPVSRNGDLGRTLAHAHAHHINPKGNKLTATGPGSDLTNISRALKQSTRLS
ncbi:MAG: hypothetical protein O3C63_04980 [Cyanobacteria bacterium]|nr:hypothetical protein [Cyanobacteriota bacterium]